MKYKHIVFDIDGTLINSEYAILHSLQDTIAQLKNEIVELSDLKFCLGITGINALKQLNIEDVEQALRIWDSNSQRYISELKVFEGIETVLEKLKNAGYLLGLITSKTRKEYEHDFLPLGLDEYFGIAVCADDTTEHKPNPEPMKQYMRTTGAVNSDILYIGDSIYDMQCADGAGVDCALALWGCHSPEGIRATYYIKSPSEVLEIINILK